MLRPHTASGASTADFESRKCKLELLGPQPKQVLFDNLVGHVGSKYHGFVMQSIVTLSKASKKQRFHPTLAVQYHGLSSTYCLPTDY